MIGLAELQSRFQSFLLGREGADMEDVTVGTERRPARRRLAIYAEAYRLRLLEVLGDDFPGLKAMIGDEAFDTLGTAYIRAHPSTHPSVRWFGRHMERFLRAAPGYSDRSALAEMAAFEWCQGEVMDAADSPIAGIEDLAALAPDRWPGMRIEFQSALRRLDLAWNIPAVWKAAREEAPPPPLARAPAAVPWLFWRQGIEVHWRSLDDEVFVESWSAIPSRGIEVHWRSLDDEERFALAAAWEGASFGAICEGMFARAGDEGVALRAAGFLKGWAADGLVAGIEA